MSELELKVAAHDEALREMRSALKEMADAVKELSLNVARLLILSERQHTPATCPIKERADDYEIRLRELEEAKAAATGGGKVLLWLIGGGAAALGTTVGLLLGR